MDLIGFKEPVRHGTYLFHPKLTYGFEDPDAAPYFKACGWAEDLPDDTEPDVVVTLGEVDVDPLTVWGNGPDRGKFVMPERAAEHLGIEDVERVRNYVATFVPGDQILEQVKADLGGDQ